MMFHDVLDARNPRLRISAALERDAALPRLVVTDHTVWSHYGEAFTAYLGASGLTCHVVFLDSSEEKKGIEQVLKVVAGCEAIELLRRTPIIGFGGGSILDVVGLAASLYRRGIPYVRLPTTLVAMIDAGIGVKTGVNHDGRKSLLGTYYPPSAVLVDTAFLETLDRRHVANGLAEALKISLVRDRKLFELIEMETDSLVRGSEPTLAREALVTRSISAMLPELTENLWEERLERLADFGHTFSPGIEMAALPRLLHGEAVALDIALSIVASQQRGLLDPAKAMRVLAVLSRLGLALFDQVMTVELLWATLQDTRRRRDGFQRVPLLTDIGQATFVNDMSAAELQVASDALRVRAVST